MERWILGFPLDQRFPAASAVARVDAAAASSALLTGYDRLDEASRLDVVGFLSKIRADSEALRGIAESDPSERVRKEAQKRIASSE